VGTADFIITIILSLFGGGTFGVIVNKWQNRKVDEGAAEKLKAEAKRLAAEAAKTEIENARAVIQEYRQMYDNRTAELSVVNAKLELVNDRLDKVEERERHALTRAAVHEAWDQFAYDFMRRHDKDVQPPPPLRSPIYELED